MTEQRGGRSLLLTERTCGQVYKIDTPRRTPKCADCGAIFGFGMNNMETTEAGFVTMVMDRLHALEEQNIELQKKNGEMSDLVSAMARCLYLKDDLRTFNDGTMLSPAFGEGETEVWLNETQSLDLRSEVLDLLHANATAFYGQVDFGFEERPQRLVIGEPDKRTTVKEFTQGIDGWWKLWKAEEPDTNVTQSMQESFDGWHFGYQDFTAEVTVYVLKLTTDILL